MEVTFHHLRYLENDVVEGEITESDYRFDNWTGDHIEVAVWMIDEYTIEPAGNGTEYVHPDGSRIIDYATGQYEQVTASLEGDDEDLNLVSDLIAQFKADGTRPVIV